MTMVITIPGTSDRDNNVVYTAFMIVNRMILIPMPFYYHGDYYCKNPYQH